MSFNFFFRITTEGSKMVKPNIKVLFYPRIVWLLVIPNVQSLEPVKTGRDVCWCLNEVPSQWKRGGVGRL